MLEAAFFSMTVLQTTSHRTSATLSSSQAVSKKQPNNYVRSTLLLSGTRITHNAMQPITTSGFVLGATLAPCCQPEAGLRGQVPEAQHSSKVAFKKKTKLNQVSSLQHFSFSESTVT